MTKTGWLFLLCSAGLLNTIAAKAQSCVARPGDDAAVEQTVRDMFAAASNDDVNKFDSVAAPGFYMYDNGQRFDGDSIMKLIAAQHAKGAKYVWNVTQPDVHVYCDEAWIAYVNDGSVQPAPGATVTPMKWLESAILRREDGRWRVVFFHSTRQAAEVSAH
ncbi:MAG TPA: nuclear transport factor 2 family protein [Candidatus Aquilonibacter sp.]|nr:nuclear transport factor 2 family protein [Candidatus Aquilonibacter sp.]